MVMEKRRRRAIIGKGDGGLSALGRLLLRARRKPRRSKWGARLSAGGHWPGSAVLGRASATRGRGWPPHGAQALSQSATELADSVRQKSKWDA